MPSSPLASTRPDRLVVIRCVERLESQIPELSICFYKKLFALDKAAEGAFKGSETFQQRKFTNMFIVFRHIKYLENMTQMVHQLGERHGGYHRRFPTFFPSMRQALLDSLRQVLSEEFTSELELALCMGQVPIQAKKPAGYRDKTYIKI